MTENTPNPAEPRTFTFDDPDVSPDTEFVERSAYDALAAILAEVRAIEPTWPRGMYGAPQDMIGRSALDRVLSKLPADALAARDARMLRKAADRLFEPGLFAHSKMRREADRIEQEARA